jgi:exopolyphosphatase/guanosine-5'-triphosphate,3'-diphosphate pyrophosphatase
MSETAAALDIGSNSVKLLVLELVAGGAYRILHDESRVTGLGRGLGQGGALSAEAVDSTLAVLREMCAYARALGAERIIAAGTAALRSASNPEAVLGPLHSALGVQGRVISGAEEARISQAAALAELRLLEPSLSGGGVFFDLGGGSLELSSLALEPGQAPRVLESVSLPAGARRLTELASLSHPVSAEMDRALADLLSQQLLAAPRLEYPPAFIAGLGGTASVLVWLRQGLDGLPPSDPHGATVTRAWLELLAARLAPLSAGEVRALPNLDPLRADIIYAGARIVLGILGQYYAEGFRLIDRGLRFGLLLGGEGPQKAA